MSLKHQYREQIDLARKALENAKEAGPREGFDGVDRMQDWQSLASSHKALAAEIRLGIENGLDLA